LGGSSVTFVMVNSLFQLQRVKTVFLSYLRLPPERINQIHRKYLKHDVHRLLPTVNVPPIQPQAIYDHIVKILSILRISLKEKAIELNWRNYEVDDSSFN